MSNYTQKAIIHTFQDMLEETSFDKITVSAIVKKCEISPNTFYYHYRDIYDLLEKWLKLTEEKYLAHMDNNLSWEDTIKVLLRDIKGNSRMVYHLFNSLSRERLERFVFKLTNDAFYKIFCEETGSAYLPEQMRQDIIEYNRYAFLGFFLKFLWNNMDDDIDEMVDKISYIFKSNIKWIVAEEKKKTENEKK